MGFWKFQDRLTSILLAWAGTSIATGAALGRKEDAFDKGLGEQFVGWGLVNAAIAIFGQRASDRKRALPEANTPEALRHEKENLSRLLWINTGLDVLYILGGLTAAQTRGRSDERWRGRGWGIVIQGGFLFFFDLINALLIREVAEQQPDQL